MRSIDNPVKISSFLTQHYGVDYEVIGALPKSNLKRSSSQFLLNQNTSTLDCLMSTAESRENSMMGSIDLEKSEKSLENSLKSPERREKSSDEKDSPTKANQEWLNDIGVSPRHVKGNARSENPGVSSSQIIPKAGSKCSEYVLELDGGPVLPHCTKMALRESQPDEFLRTSNIPLKPAEPVQESTPDLPIDLRLGEKLRLVPKVPFPWMNTRKSTGIVTMRSPIQFLGSPIPILKCLVPVLDEFTLILLSMMNRRVLKTLQMIRGQTHTISLRFSNHASILVKTSPNRLIDIKIRKKERIPEYGTAITLDSNSWGIDVKVMFIRRLSSHKSIYFDIEGSDANEDLLMWNVSQMILSLFDSDSSEFHWNLPISRHIKDLPVWKCRKSWTLIELRESSKTDDADVDTGLTWIGNNVKSGKYDFRNSVQTPPRAIADLGSQTSWFATVAFATDGFANVVVRKRRGSQLTGSQTSRSHIDLSSRLPNIIWKCKDILLRNCGFNDWRKFVTETIETVKWKRTIISTKELNQMMKLWVDGRLPRLRLFESSSLGGEFLSDEPLFYQIRTQDSLEPHPDFDQNDSRQWWFGAQDIMNKQNRKATTVYAPPGQFKMLVWTSN
ncbi:hypothetical protein CRE_18144 [Caenorhabditis remanei]|uniref:F-box associated domain-containing protein n=1 Tax=Caenorhabditis remanei TaxID=31234 RepID=E3N367_CAERE|nr:hypothetical protein CRE_18144 [Caenorhabditis remanei]